MSKKINNVWPLLNKQLPIVINYFSKHVFQARIWTIGLVTGLILCSLAVISAAITITYKLYLR